MGARIVLRGIEERNVRNVGVPPATVGLHLSRHDHLQVDEGEVRRFIHRTQHIVRINISKGEVRSQGEGRGTTRHQVNNLFGHFRAAIYEFFHFLEGRPNSSGADDPISLTFFT